MSEADVGFLPPPSHPQTGSRHRVRNLAAAVVVVCAVAGVLRWGVQAINRYNERLTTERNFKQIALGIRNVDDVYRHVPLPFFRESPKPPRDICTPNGTGRPTCSWRVAIIPYLECWHGSRDAFKPWDSPANRDLVERSTFYSYDSTHISRDAAEPDGKSFPETNVLAITGPDTVFGDGEETPKAIQDVPPQTILLVESRASGIPWPAPGDFDVRTMPQTINAPDGAGISSRHTSGFHVAFADGDVWFLSHKTPFATLKRFLTIKEAAQSDREELLGPHRVGR
jgi:hypothetical protein